MPVEEGGGAPTVPSSGSKLYPTVPPGTEGGGGSGSNVPIYMPQGDGNRFQGNAGGGGATGGLDARIFELSKEFTVLPIRFGYLYKDSIQILAASAWVQVSGFSQGVDAGIRPDAPSGVIIFPDLPPSAWVQVYGWLRFAANATGIRRGRLVDVATGSQLAAALEGQNANAAEETAFSWQSLPIVVGDLSAGVRLEAYQTSGGPLNLEEAALWVKRVL